jgi:hypothetical protein
MDLGCSGNSENLIRREKTNSIVSHKDACNSFFNSYAVWMSSVSNSIWKMRISWKDHHKFVRQVVTRVANIFFFYY